MNTPKSQEQLQKEEQDAILFNRKLMVMKLLQKMKMLKKKNSKAYKQCQEQIFRLVKAGADPNAEIFQFKE